MLKKLGVIFFAATSVAHASDKLNTDAFNPESAMFSQMQTIKTWVAPKHHDNKEHMDGIQRNVAMHVPQNQFSLNFCQPIQNNDGEKRYFGKSFQTIQASELPYLQYVHQVSQAHDNPIILELAASYGGVSWKVPLAFKDKGSLYVNELSQKMLNQLDSIVNHRLPIELREMVHKIPGDCFGITELHPELVGKVNAIYVQNLEHFFNPVQHQQFLGLISSLLAPGGRAFLTAHTLKSLHYKKGDPVLQLYTEKKQTEMYPGFMTVTVKTTIALENHANLGTPEILSALRPDDVNATCDLTNLEKSEPYYVNYKNYSGWVKDTTLRATDQFYTPTIYKAAVASHPLKIVDSFFVDSEGNRHDKFTDSNSMSFATAIVEKTS